MTEFPDDAQGYIYLGSMLAGSGQLQQAERIHRLGTSCKSGCIDEAFLNLGCVFAAQRRYAEAIECFDRAIKRDPQYEDAITAREDCETRLSADGRDTPVLPGLMSHVPWSDLNCG